VGHGTNWWGMARLTLLLGLLQWSRWWSSVLIPPWPFPCCAVRSRGEGLHVGLSLLQSSYTRASVPAWALRCPGIVGQDRTME
jgi:hypothetical protein